MTAMMTALDPLDHLDASLQDFELKPSPPPFGYPSAHSGFRTEDTESDPADSISAGGYSPPAWRRLGNGDRSSGFWRRATNDILGPVPFRSRESSPEYESADEGEEDVLERAIRTRLPAGSLSPEKDFSAGPEEMRDTTIRLSALAAREKSYSRSVVSPRQTPAADNCTSTLLICMP